MGQNQIGSELYMEYALEYVGHSSFIALNVAKLVITRPESWSLVVSDLFNFGVPSMNHFHGSRKSHFVDGLA